MDKEPTTMTEIIMKGREKEQFILAKYLLDKLGPAFTATDTGFRVDPRRLFKLLGDLL